MKPIKDFFSDFFNWEKICVDDNLRLKTNSILFFIAIALIGFVMAVLNFVTSTVNLLIVTSALCIIFIIFSIIAIKSGENTKIHAKLMAVAFFVTWLMAAYFLYSGGTEGFSVIWLCIFPIIGYLVAPMWMARIFNIGLVLTVYIAFLTPVYNLLAYEYTGAFRFRFPVVMAFGSMCAWISELVRFQTQKRLAIITQRLKESAHIDPLTGVGNRNAFKEEIEKNRNSSSLCYVIIDVDHFKSVNDKYGHAAGDIVLKDLAIILTDNIRPLDRVYRWGGEEFLVILPRTEHEDFKHMLERLRGLVERHEFVVNDELSLNVTISLGGVSGCEGADAEHCINIADECMYVAKEKGRNRVVARGFSSSRLEFPGQATGNG